MSITCRNNILNTFDLQVQKFTSVMYSIHTLSIYRLNSNYGIYNEVILT